jgi:hypothetical protein
VKQLCPRSTVLDGFSVEGGSERDGKLQEIEGERAKAVEVEIEKWLQRIRID